MNEGSRRRDAGNAVSVDPRRPETAFYRQPAGRLRAQLLEQGVSPAVADGIVGWVTGRAAGQVDGRSPATAAAYRRQLRQLLERARMLASA